MWIDSHFVLVQHHAVWSILSDWRAPGQCGLHVLLQAFSQ